MQTTCQKFTKIANKCKIVEFHFYIWNHNEKCIKVSTNMLGIGLIIREIVIEMSEFGKNKNSFGVVEDMAMH